MNVDGNGNAYVNVPWTDNNTTYGAATQSVAGLMSAADKKKLDNIETSDKLIGYVNANRNVYPGDAMTIGASGVTLAIGIATEKMCKVGARAYIYQANTSNCKFTLDNIRSVLASTAAKNQITISGNTITLKQAMGLWTITWLRNSGIWIDFDSMNTIVK